MEYPELSKYTKNYPLIMNCKETATKFNFQNGKVELGGGTARTITASYCKHPDTSDGGNLILEIIDEKHNGNS